MSVLSARKASLSKWALGSTGMILIAMGCLHSLGYGPFSEALAGTNLEAFWQGGVKGLSLIYTVHLIIIGSIVLTAAVRPRAVGQPILIVIGLIPVTDALLLLAFVGVFVGSIFLGAATALLCAGVVSRPA
jgi:hypothetical protein